MPRAQFQEVHPVLPVTNVEQSIEYYSERLGFKIAFRDCSDPENYVGVRRDGVEIHLQFQYEKDMPKRGAIMLRFIVDDPDALFVEYSTQNVFHERTNIADKPWGTREFAFYDLSGNGLTFYRDL